MLVTNYHRMSPYDPDPALLYNYSRYKNLDYINMVLNILEISYRI